MIAGVCVSLQSFSEASIGRRLDPSEMRSVLRNTGIPQGSGGNIGNFPNMVEAGQYIIDSFAVLGDANIDGVVNVSDISPFITVLMSGIYLHQADVDQNGIVNFADIPPFIAILNAR